MYRGTPGGIIRLSLSTLLLAALVLHGGWATAAEPDPELVQAEATLKEAHVGTDGPALLTFFRSRTLSEEDRARLAATVRKLGDESYAVRDEATKALIRAGSIARPLLMAARKDPDPEIAHRVARCLRIIDSGSELVLAEAAARLLAVRKPAGTTAVLLAYLPAVAEEYVLDSLLASLASVGVTDGKADPALVRALEDREPVRRAAAAHVLGRAVPAQRAAVVRLLADRDPQVRFRAASALLRSGESRSVDTLIALVGDGKTEVSGLAEDLLSRIAGEGTPKDAFGGDAEGRRKSRAAWEAWWKASSDRINLAKLNLEEVPLGLTLVCEHNESGKGGNGKVWAFGRDGKVRWEFDNVTNPVDVRMLPNGRILVAEHQGRCVTERDRQGRILWKHTVTSFPTSCQRLPNGNTLIGTYTELVEVSRDNKVIATYQKGNGNLFSARKLANGHIVCGTGRGVLELDATGREVRNLPLTGGHIWCRVEVLRNGHFLVSEWAVGQVSEIDNRGSVVWEAKVGTPTSATRLANGHVLVSNAQGHQLVELDRKGKEVWSQKTTGRPFRIRRY